MEPIGLLAVAIGIGCFVLLAAVSMSRTRVRRRRVSRDGAFIPGYYPHDHDSEGA